MKKQRCIIIGSSPDADAAFIGSCIKADDFVICADGGLEYARKNDIIPDLLIGDFDSGRRPETEICETITLSVRKDDTDTMFCAREALRRGFDDVLLFGMTGGRTDHSYANLCVLLFLEKNGAHAKMLAPELFVRVLPPESVTLSGMNGRLFSAFPFGCEECTVSLDGFDYPLNRGRLLPDNTLGLSNVIISDKAAVTVHSGNAVIVITG